MLKKRNCVPSTFIDDASKDVFVRSWPASSKPLTKKPTKSPTTPMCSSFKQRVCKYKTNRDRCMWVPGEGCSERVPTKFPTRRPTKAPTFGRRRADKNKMQVEKVSQKVRVGKQRLRSSYARPNLCRGALPKVARSAQMSQTARANGANQKKFEGSARRVNGCKITHYINVRMHYKLHHTAYK